MYLTEHILCRDCAVIDFVTVSRKITCVRCAHSRMIDPLTSGSAVLLALAAIALLAVVIVAVRIAIKLAIRVGIVAAIVLAGLYTVGVIG